MLDELSPARVRAGWTLPAALAGLAAAAAGEWLMRSVADAYTACDLSKAIEDITGASYSPIDCGGVTAQNYTGAGLLAAGALIALVALIVAGRRGRAAARQGHPWAVRRFLTRVAVAVDRGLPGASQQGTPRIRAGAVGALLSCLLLVAVLGVHAAWGEHQRSAEMAHRQAAERALDRLVFPAGITRGAGTDSVCKPSVDTLCGSSSQSMEELRPAMESLIAGQSNTLACELIPRPKGMPCPVTVYGKIAGYPAVATVFQHEILVKDGNPPAGAVPRHLGPSYGIYVLGTDITVGLIVPVA